MAESEETTFRFEELDNTTVAVSVLNGSEPFNIELKDVTWGMLEDILAVQDTAQNDPRAIFKFLNDYVEGGTRAIPLNKTMPLFQAIAEYMSQVMNTQKN